MNTEASSARHALSVLVVCTANECRSPAAAFVLGRSLEFEVLSAGMHARPGSAICALVSSRISATADGAEYAEAFSSTSVRSLDLAGFDLLFTATRAIRSELVGRSPQLRDRAFTMREAVALLAREPSGLELEDVLARGPAPVMLARRGTIVNEAMPRRPRRGKWIDPLDIPDWHEGRHSRQHAEAVTLALGAGAELAALINAWRAAASGDRHP